MSDVVTTQFGHHLILVTERKAGHAIKFEEARDEVKEVYAQRIREDLCGQLRQNTKISINPAPK
jgi:peptidyl-prolyl cis-trans isomerase C